MDVMDIHHHFWICMDMDMVDIQMDIQNGYPCCISMSIMDIQHAYHVWISMISMISRALEDRIVLEGGRGLSKLP